MNENVIRNIKILYYDYFFKITYFILKYDSSSCFLILDEILKLGFESKHFITGLAEHFRNLLLCKDESVSKLIEVSDGIQTKYSKQSEQISNEITFNALDILNSFDINYNLSSNKRLHAEIVIAKLCRLKKKTQVVSKDTPEEKVKNSENKKEDNNNSTQNKKEEAPDKSEINVNALPPKKTIAKSSPDLNSILKEEVKHKVKDKDEKINSIVNEKNQNLDKKNLKSFLDEYIKIKNISNSKLSVLNKEFTIDKNEISIKLGSDLENEIFEDLKNDLLLKIKGHFKNQEIKFKISIDKKKKSKKLYTGKEKFEFLMKNNKEIKNLKNQFNLDYEF